MDFRDRHVIVTGGTGALGVAVVGALLDAGAYCHVPCMSEAKGQRFTYHAHPRVQLIPHTTLADEAAVATLFDAVPNLWASIHLVGGFAMKPVSRSRRFSMPAAIDSEATACRRRRRTCRF